MDKYNIEILRLLKEKENFDFEAYKLPMLTRRINNRIIQTYSESPEKYLQLLVKNDDESKHLINNFMINVSHFFRDPFVFEFLKSVIIPELIAQIRLSGQNSIRIWSAGCSRGEEAYSLAILLHEFFENEVKDVSIDFFATDYDNLALNSAREGMYDLTSLEETKSKYLQKYFTKSEGKYEVCSSIKSMVKFSEYNLIDKNSYVPSESIFGNFDLVLCRNVLIYFNENYQDIIFDKLYKSLSPDKVLVLGEAEMPPQVLKEKFGRDNNYFKVYRKK